MQFLRCRTNKGFSLKEKPFEINTVLYGIHAISAFPSPHDMIITVRSNKIHNAIKYCKHGKAGSSNHRQKRCIRNTKQQHKLGDHLKSKRYMNSCSNQR